MYPRLSRCRDTVGSGFGTGRVHKPSPLPFISQVSGRPLDLVSFRAPSGRPVTRPTPTPETRFTSLSATVASSVLFYFRFTFLFLPCFSLGSPYTSRSFLVFSFDLHFFFLVITLFPTFLHLLTSANRKIPSPLYPLQEDCFTGEKEIETHLFLFPFIISLSLHSYPRSQGRNVGGSPVPRSGPVSSPTTPPLIPSAYVLVVLSRPLVVHVVGVPGEVGPEDRHVHQGVEPRVREGRTQLGVVGSDEEKDHLPCTRLSRTPVEQSGPRVEKYCRQGVMG